MTMRRHVVSGKVAIALACLVAAGGLSGCTSTGGAPGDTVAAGAPVATADAPWTKDVRDRMTPAEALARLEAGNLRFVEGRMFHRDLWLERKTTAQGQFPFAVVLGCIDSRAPAELVFDAGLGQLFNGRVAGNFVDTDLAGSLEYSCKVSGAKLILVMGHTDCGAIKSACDSVQMGNITAMLANIRPAVDAVAAVAGEHNSSNKAFVKAVTEENVRQTMARIRELSPILREMDDHGAIEIAGCVYDLSSGTAKFLD